jgi:hypothetical protein
MSCEAYRQKAKEILDQAAEQKNEAQRARLTCIALAFLRLADQADRTRAAVH